MSDQDISGQLAEDRQAITERIAERQAELYSKNADKTPSEYIGVQAKCIATGCDFLLYPITAEGIVEHQHKTFHKWQVTIGKRRNEN